jgi:hypothetical protein
MKTIGGRTATCYRGHDTSFPEARDSTRRCKKCKSFYRNRIYDILYEQTPERKYFRYKRLLQNRIRVKRERLLQYDEKVRNRNGASASG